MATLTTAVNIESLAVISSRLTHLFRPCFTAALNEEVTLWSLLPKRRSAAEAVRVKLHIGKPAQVYNSAYVDYAIYTVPVPLDTFEQARTLAQGHGNYDLWADETACAAEKMREDLERALWGKQHGNGSLGIQDAIGPDEGIPSYLGLTRAGYPFLRAAVVDADGPLTFTPLRALFRQVQHGTGADIEGDEMTFKAADQGGGRVDVLLTTPEVETTYEALVTSNNRYPLPPAPDRCFGPALTDLVYRRAPILGNAHCPAGALYALDLSTWSIEILPQVTMNEKGERDEAGFALVVEGMPGGKVSAFWRVYFQVVCSKPWRNGRIDGIVV